MHNLDRSYPEQSSSALQAGAENHLAALTQNRRDSDLWQELQQQIGVDPELFQFLCAEPTDGIRYLCLDNPSLEWQSPSLRHLLGYSADDTLSEATCDALASSRLLLAEIYRKAGTFDIGNDLLSFSYPDHEGRPCYVQCRQHVLCDKSGRPFRLVSAQRRAPAANLPVPLIEERFHQFVELSNDVFWVTELFPEERICYTSPAVARIWGRAPEEFYRDPRLWIECILPEDRPSVAAKFSDWLIDPANRSYDAEYRILRPAGEIRWIHDTGSAAKVVDGTVIQVSGVAEDITSRKAAEEAFRNSQRLYEELVATVDGIVWEIDPKTFQFRFVSQQAERLLGYPIQQWLGDPDFWPAHLHPEDRDFAVNYCTTAVQAHLDHEFEYRMIASDGRIVWLHDIVSLVIDEGEVTSLRGIMVDITERKLAEEAALASQRHFRELTESLPQLVFTCLPNGSCDYLSPQWITYTGVPGEEQLGSGWVKQVHPEDRDRVTEIWRESVARESVFDAEFRIRRHDGQFRWFKTRAVPLRSADGRITHWFGTNTDIHDLKELTATIREERDRLAMIASASPSMIHTFHLKADGTQCFPYGSERLADLYAIPAEELAANAARALQRIHPEDFEWIDQTVQRSLQELTPWFEQFRLIHPTRGVVWVEGHSVPVPEADGGMMWHGALTDITDRKLAEQKILELNAELEVRVSQRTAELEAANRELEAFSYSVSHDLRAPLRAMDGFSQALLEDYSELLPEEGQRFVATIRRSAQKMGELIDDLLSFSRLSRQALNKRPVDMRALVTEVLESLQPQMSGRSVDVAIAELPKSQGDPVLLKQVWMNLLTNALKYTSRREHATIEIGCMERSGHLHYFVRDNGTGFDMRYANKLFGVFQRLHRAEDFEGTGVGLAIVKRIVQRHGGAVHAEGKHDHGAVFSFTLE